MTGPLIGSAAASLAALPPWVRLIRAANPGPMTLTGTNTWVLDGGVVIDPGPDDKHHLGAVAAAGEVSLTLITHGHPDHVDGLYRWVMMTGAPVRAVDPKFCIDAEPLVDGETVEGLTVWHTPGHTADSACFVHEDAVFTGDTVLGAGSTIVVWPEGRLADYLDSLRRLATLTGRAVLPGHGPALIDCAAAAQTYLAHRLARLDQVRAALAGGASGVAAVTDEVYADLDPVLRPAAELTVRAQLDFLER